MNATTGGYKMGQIGHMLCLKAIEALREIAKFCGVVDHNEAFGVSSVVDVHMAAMSKRMYYGPRHARAALDSYAGLTIWGEHNKHSTHDSDRSLLVQAQFTMPDHLNRSSIIMTLSRFRQQTEPKMLDPVIEEVIDFEIRFGEGGIPELKRFACHSKMHADTLAHEILSRTIPYWKEAFFPDIIDWPEQERALTSMLTPGYVIPASEIAVA